MKDRKYNIRNIALINSLFKNLHGRMDGSGGFDMDEIMGKHYNGEESIGMTYEIRYNGTVTIYLDEGVLRLDYWTFFENDMWFTVNVLVNNSLRRTTYTSLSELMRNQRIIEALEKDALNREFIEFCKFYDNYTQLSYLLRDEIKEALALDHTVRYIAGNLYIETEEGTVTYTSEQLDSLVRVSSDEFETDEYKKFSEKLDCTF